MVIDVDLGFSITAHQRFRLTGIDTPELNSSDINERELAKAAKQYVIERLLGRGVTVVSHKTGKYGRYLGTIFVDGININEELVNIGLAEVY